MPATAASEIPYALLAAVLVCLVCSFLMLNLGDGEADSFGDGDSDGGGDGGGGD